MKRFLFYAVLLFTGMSQAFAATRIIPVAGHIPGANGTSWTTDVTLRNTTSAPMSVSLVFHSDRGITRSRSVTLAAGGSLLLEDAVDPSRFPGSNPPAWLGQLEIQSPDQLTASAHIFTKGREGGTFGSTHEGVDPEVLSEGGTIPGLVNDAHFRSNVAFANPSDAGIALSYSLRNMDGSVAASRTLDLPAHTTRQTALSEDVGGDSHVSLFWSATGPAYAVGSIIDNASGDPTSVPSVSRQKTSLFFPVIGRTSGANSTFWSTSASITGVSGVDASVTFAYTDAGTGRTFIHTAILPALGSIRTDDVNDLVGAPAGTGSLRVTSTAPLAGVVRVFNRRSDGSTFGSSILPQYDVVRSSSVSIDGVRRDDDYRLNVAVVNDDSRDAQGQVRLFDDRGFEVESHAFTVRSGKSIQVPVSGSIGVHAGEVRVETEHGVPVTATASNVNNITGDTVQRDSQQESERQNELEIQMGSRTAPIGTPVTFAIRNAGGNVTQASWNFGDGATAIGVNATHAFTSVGEFEVSVAITLAGGAIVHDREDIRITSGGATPQQSAIDFSWTPANPAAGEQVVFTARGETNGGFFKWKFPGNIRPAGNTVSFTFPASGAFVVEVEIEHGATVAQVERVVTVGGSTGGNPPNIGPVDFTWFPSAPQAGQPVTFTATGNTGGGVFRWKFPGNVRPTGATASFTFPANGSYEVEVEVEHGSEIAEITKIVTVGNTNPPSTGQALSFSFSPAAPQAGAEVTFTASGDTGGGVYKWKFPGNVRKLGQVVTFTFGAAGTYDVELEIEHGTIASEVTKKVIVGGAVNTPPPSGAALDFTYSPAPRAGREVIFTASGETGGGTYKWRFPGNVRKSGAAVAFTFASAGSFVVELEIEHGSIEGEVQKTVMVSP
jgi:hypothetical protein